MVSPEELRELNARIAELTVGTKTADRREVAVTFGDIRAYVVPVGVVWRLEVPVGDDGVAILPYGRKVCLQEVRGEGIRLCIGEARSDGYHVKGYLAVRDDLEVSVEGVSRCSR